MANFDFSRLRDIERIAGDRMDKVVRGTLLDLSRRIVLRTPVGNPSLWQGPPPPGYTGGQARGNWQASIGSPASGTTEATDRSGTATISGIAGDTHQAPGNVWYLTNNLPYIGKLEFDGQAVIIEQVNVAQGLASGSWWLMPVSVNWRAFG